MSSVVFVITVPGKLNYNKIILLKSSINKKSFAGAGQEIRVSFELLDQTGNFGISIINGFFRKDVLPQI